ncbi:hypothetical protein ACHAPV_002527 [Trichoderma viride]
MRANSYTKLLAFDQTQYERVIVTDSDTALLKHMDELFHLLPCPITMPRAYWFLGNEITKETLASHFLVIQPDKYELDRIQKAIKLAAANESDFKARKATVCARETWPKNEEVELGPLREGRMIDLSPILYLKHNATLSVLMSMDKNEVGR